MEDGKRVGIHVFVGKGQCRPELPAQLDGVPIRFIESGPFVAHNGPCDLSDCHTETLLFPVQMGNSNGIENGFFAGTFKRGCSRSLSDWQTLPLPTWCARLLLA